MKLSEEAYRQLYGQILPFWKGLRDHQRGGFVSLVDFDLRRCAEAERGCILNSRILWFFSEAYRTLGDADLLDDAHHAYAMLRKMEDKEYGGVYWSVWPDGTVADSTKHTYNQAFAIYALSSFYRASGCSEALSKAMELMGIIESRMCDEDGYLEAFHRDFSRTGNEKLSENGVNATRTMNTLLHLLEAYTNLYEVSEDTVVRGKILHILDVWEKYIFDPEQRRQNVFFDEKYRSLLDLHRPAHLSIS